MFYVTRTVEHRATLVKFRGAITRAVCVTLCEPKLASTLQQLHKHIRKTVHNKLLSIKNANTSGTAR